MKRSLKWILLIGILVLGVWYFLLKDHHYRISFNSSEPQAILFHHILDWENYKLDEADITTLSRNNYSEVVQRVKSGDSSFLYRWRIKKNTDDKTRVTVFITDEKNGFIQKLEVPFSNDFVKGSITYVKTIVDALKLKSEVYKVHSIADTLILPTYCAYLPLESSVRQKAPTMLRGIAVIMDYIKSNEIPLNGDPFLEITEWNEETDSIRFNFCFPVKRIDSIPRHPDVKFKTTEPVNGIKAEFNGNYRISDNAWYYLLEYAEKNNREIEKLPLEVYLNDPHSGSDPLQWKAHILVPLKE